MKCNKMTKCCKKTNNNKYYIGKMQSFEVNMEQLIQMQAQGAIILDIRSPQEYKEWHISGAKLLPEYEINKEAIKLFPNKNQIIVLYCENGSRSSSSQKKFKQLGYNNVYNLYKGLEYYK